jgi:hypothetical protein
MADGPRWARACGVERWKDGVVSGLGRREDGCNILEFFWNVSNAKMWVSKF